MALRPDETPLQLCGCMACLSGRNVFLPDLQSPPSENVCQLHMPQRVSGCVRAQTREDCKKRVRRGWHPTQGRLREEPGESDEGSHWRLPLVGAGTDATMRSIKHTTRREGVVRGVEEVPV